MIRSFLLLAFFYFSSYFSLFSKEIDTLLVRIKSEKPLVQARELKTASETCWQTGQYDLGMMYAQKALKIAVELKNKKYEAAILNNIGIIYDYQGDYPQALKCYFKALKIQENRKNKNGIAYIYSNIGLIYSSQGSNEAALNYHYKSLKLRKEINDKGGMAASYNNIGICHLNTKKYPKALYYFTKSHVIDSTLQDSIGLMDDLNNLGICFMKTDQIDKAMVSFEKCLALRLHYNDQFGAAKVYSNIATCFFIQKNLPQAEKYFKMSLDISLKIDGKENSWYAYENLSEIYRDQKKYKVAYEFALKGQEIKNKFNDENDIRNQAETELNYEFEKKLQQNKILQVKKDIKEKEGRKQAQIIIWSMVSIVVLVGFFLVILFRRWKLASNQQRIIEAQRALVQEKNTEIVDSINYAQRIQTAILPSEESLKDSLKNHALFYQPKDIVAGDFYWTHQVNKTVYFAVADCTGHGVPGAFMSLLCSNALNRVILENGIISPGQLLTKVREIIVAEFAKSQMNLNDGMDISVCSWNQENNTCQWAGANNPLWILYPDSSEMTEIKGDKQPVGNHYHHLSDFNTHEVSLSSGARLYLFTDGIADQFGEISGKKFKSRKLKDLLLSSREKTIQTQVLIVKESVNTWKGNLEQIDDVCLLIVEI